MYVGELVEFGETKTLFESSKSELACNYINGKFWFVKHWHSDKVAEKTGYIVAFPTKVKQAYYQGYMKKLVNPRQSPPPHIGHLTRDFEIEFVR